MLCSPYVVHVPKSDRVQGKSALSLASETGPF